MQKEIIVRGKLCDPLHIELEEPVTELAGEVEIVLRALPTEAPESVDFLIFVDSLPPDDRPKKDVDQQSAEERDS